MKIFYHVVSHNCRELQQNTIYGPEGTYPGICPRLKLQKVRSEKYLH
jgi:hypothetical protein